MINTIVIVIVNTIVPLLFPLVDLILFTFYIVPFLNKVLRQTLHSSPSLIVVLTMLDSRSGAHELEWNSVVMIVEVE